MKNVFFLFLFTYTNLCAQKKVEIKDASTKQPLPYATVECFEKRWGKYADAMGVVIIPDSVLQYGKLVFNYVGFKADTLQHLTTQEVLLLPLPARLSDVTITTCNEFEVATIEVRNRKINYSFGYGENLGFMWATYVPNTTAKKGVLKTFAFAARGPYSKENAKTPVRLRLFQYDSATGLPAAEITDQVITLSPGKLNWVTFDMQQYKLPIPADGVVAAFEMFDAGPQYHFTTVVIMSDKSKKTVKHYGYTIVGITNEKVLGFMRFPGGGWRRFTNLQNISSAPQVSLGITVCKK